ncbi:MAG: hypothetical protein EAX96_20415 [Candidatus Lokiarchaeota archaeon]|nr:hypothetical protein [Candidatus Lokiarchaeota archaeon]
MMKNEVLESVSNELIGKEITLKGEVANCKAGPCLSLKDGSIIYVQELNDELIGKKIKLKATFLRKKIIPDPMIDENGAISTGAHGDQFILENIKDLVILSE